MKGITRLLNSISRHKGSVTYSPSSLIISHRPLFISAVTKSLLDSRSSSFPLNWIVQRRTMFIQTQSTPNPSSLMFNSGKPVMEIGSADFPNPRSAMGSPLAKAIFNIDGVVRVFFGSEYVTVTKSDDVTWDVLKPEIFAAVMDFYSSGQPLFLDSQATAAKDTAIHEDDSETVAMIKELLETRIRPSIRRGETPLVNVYDISTWKKLGFKKLSKKTASTMAVSLDGKYIALGGKDGDVSVAEVETMEIYHYSKRLHLGHVLLKT